MKPRHVRRKRRPATFRPRLEALENRCCPSCDVSVVDGHILHILGDETANRIEIRQTSDGITNVSCDGTTASFRGINAFDIATRAGNDFVTANFANPPDGDFTFRADLGAGNDVLNLDWQDPTHYDEAQPPRDMRFNIVTGAGDDVIDARFMNPRDPNFTFFADLGTGDDRLTLAMESESSQAGSNRQALIDITAGVGNDFVSADFVNPPDGDFNFRADLGAGNDALDLDWQDPTHYDEAQPPRDMRFNIFAAAGDDAIDACFMNPRDPNLTFFADLGTGDDTFTAGLTESDLGPGVAQIDPGNRIAFDVLGQQGNDRLSLFLGEPDTSPQPHLFNTELAVNFGGGAGADNFVIAIIDVAVTSSLNVNINGDDGADTVGIDVMESIVARDALFAIDVHGAGGADMLRLSTVGLLVESGGQFSACLEGNAGDDVLDVSLSAYGTGVYDVEVMGGAGDDDLTLGISGIGDPNALTALLDGGDGFDVAHVTRDVLVRNCEEVFFIE